ncbi:Predicted arabinose efflux permease, MFS family [Actinopolymorpha cephalotaxi]|uniref:MFS family permease n=1 Tax=Actinopolymorpha cephalotaxi TaxID=504797 RepID=A0A1I3B5G7_9ACTN|nr:MFS transporter [Actinopolymorpha cephalotaxi]NYH81261.1 MFS family permease [Actinopolymorpha cephalotaxi]SFH57524.1 Predicted arabinose efflux permease, MFS family [Actinopolymorpha cephalotaxi]
MEPRDRPPGRPLGPPGRRAGQRAAPDSPGADRTRPLDEQPAGENGSTPNGSTPSGPTPNGSTPNGSAPPRNDPNSPPRRSRARAARDGLTRTAGVVGAAGARAGRGARRAGGAGVRRVRRATHAQGMGESGLAKLIELNAFHAGGDAAMAIGLAGTLFFAVPSGEARGRVALYLLITMAPFVVVAPLIGPFLDRFRRGRRWAIGSTMAVRAFFCWVMAGGVATGALWLYPLVFGCLIASKAHNVTRAAAVPRLLPDGVALVTANSRISLAGSIGAGVVGAAAGGLAYFGSQWPLRFAFVVFAAGTVAAILLPTRVDSAEGEEDVRIADIGRRLRGISPSIGMALRANVAFRVLSGFLLMFMAFLLREVPLPGWSATVQVAAVVGAAGAGNLVGTALGALARARRPELVVSVLLGVTAVVAALAATFYGLVTVAVLAFAAGFAQQAGKLSLDALIQHEVPEAVRTSVFARSETLIQLAWVVGGGIGIVLPLIPQLGLGLCAAGLAAGLVVVLRTPRGSASAPSTTTRTAQSPQSAQTPPGPRTPTGAADR